MSGIVNLEIISRYGLVKEKGKGHTTDPKVGTAAALVSPLDPIPEVEDPDEDPDEEDDEDELDVGLENGELPVAVAQGGVPVKLLPKPLNCLFETSTVSMIVLVARAELNPPDRKSASLIPSPSPTTIMTKEII